MTVHGGKFRKLPVRRAVGRTAECVCAIDSGLSATGFSHPAESVVRASASELFRADRSYLEIGGGNLRNALFVQRETRPQRMVVAEQPSVVARFAQQYAAFKKSGGEVREELPRGRFDTIVMTYVIETVCPPADREALLSAVADRMAAGSRLVLSVRGYPGVRGKHYKRCPHSDGWVTPRGAFVRAYSLVELRETLGRHRIEFEPLLRYRTDKPENIHGIGQIRNG